MPKFEQYTEETAPTNDDLVLIKEKTSGATRRVQLQNVLPAGSVTTSKLSNSSITNAKLSTATGDPGGPRATWTPTWTNLTPGNGTLVARYTQIGKTVHGYIRFIFGTTSTISGAPSFTAPLPAASHYGATEANIVGVGYANDSGVAALNSAVGFNSSTTNLSIYSMLTSGTYGNFVTISGTAPVTWGAGDIVVACEFTYEAA